MDYKHYMVSCSRFPPFLSPCTRALDFVSWGGGVGHFFFFVGFPCPRHSLSIPLAGFDPLFPLLSFWKLLSIFVIPSAVPDSDVSGFPEPYSMRLEPSLYPVTFYIDRTLIIYLLLSPSSSPQMSSFSLLQPFVLKQITSSLFRIPPTIGSVPPLRPDITIFLFILLGLFDSSSWPFSTVQARFFRYLFPI